MKTERLGALRASFINMRRRHHTFPFSVFRFHFQMILTFVKIAVTKCQLKIVWHGSFVIQKGISASLLAHFFVWHYLCSASKRNNENGVTQTEENY